MGTRIWMFFRKLGGERMKKEPKFKYGDKVKIVEGFYRGIKGKVIDFKLYEERFAYLLKANGWKKTIERAWLYEERLEKRKWYK